MVNLRKLLTNICTSIKTLLDWKETGGAGDKVDALGHRGEYYRKRINSDDAPGPASVKVNNNTYTNILQLTVPAGRWLFYGQVNWPANGTGRRYICLGSNSAASNSWRTSVMANTNSLTCRQNLIVSAQYDEENTVYLVGYQSSGSALTVDSGELMAVRIA